MPKSIVPQSNAMPLKAGNMNNVSEISGPKNVNKDNEGINRTLTDDKNLLTKQSDIKSIEISTATADSPKTKSDSPEISQNQFSNLRKNPNANTNNIFGEISDFKDDQRDQPKDSENSDPEETNNDVISEILETVDSAIELPELDSIKYDNSDDSEGDSEDDEVSSSSDNDDDDNNDNNDGKKLNSDKVKEFKKLSVRALKEKCIELNLPHSGNKTTTF